MSSDAQDLAIKVEGLGKQYRIGGPKQQTRSLREAIAQSTSNFWKSAKSVFSGAVPGMGTELFWALKDITFDVQRGEVLGIIGRNGAGKSTLLKILSRITEPTEGRAILRGRVAALLEVGTGFHGELTGRENIYLSGSILGMKKKEIERKFDEIVAFSGIERFLETPVKRYSSGMYVRLGFAVAAHLEPEILVIDEVLAVGDAAFQKKCAGKMNDVARSGRTVLFVSHNMAAVEGLCTRAIVLREGRQVFDGSAKDGISHYLRHLDEAAPADLQERTDRRGQGPARAAGIRILNEAGEETNTVRMGEDVTVELRTSGVYDNAIVAIMIGNVFRQQIIRGHTYEQVSARIDLRESSLLRCRFKKLPLMHGTYDIHVWIGRGVKGAVELADFVERAAQLTVAPTDIFGTGKLPDPSGGLVFCEIHWDLEETGNA